MSWVAVAVGGGLGLAKAEFVDRPKEDRQRKLAAATQQFSPWTGLKANDIQTADPFGSTMQGGAQGAAFGQGMANADAQRKLQGSMSNYFNAKAGDPTAGMTSVSDSSFWNPQTAAPQNPWSLGY